jgi:hypothetical protein
MFSAVQLVIFVYPVSCTKTKIKIYKTIILPSVLYAPCHLEENRLWVFDNRELRRISRLKWEQVIGR